MGDQMREYITERKPWGYWCSEFDMFSVEDRSKYVGTKLAIDLDYMVMASCGGRCFGILWDSDEYAGKFPPNSLIICEHVVYAPSNTLGQNPGLELGPMEQVQEEKKAVEAELQKVKIAVGEKTRIRYIEVPQTDRPIYKIEMADRPE